MGTNLYLLEALKQLCFIDADILKETNHQDAHDRYRKLKVALRDQKSNLVILEGGKGGAPDDIAKNLFKICCAILNLRPGQRGLTILDDHLLQQYLDQIYVNRFLLDDNLLIQFQVIKNLINRRAFALNER
jgi:NAD kinase